MKGIFCTHEYDEGAWHPYQTKEDLDEIIESHLQQGKIVERLKR